MKAHTAKMQGNEGPEGWKLQNGGKKSIPRRGASKKPHFRQGSFAGGKGLTGSAPIPARGASKKSHFRWGSFAEGKGWTGKKPIPGRCASKKILFQAGVVCRGQGLDRKRKEMKAHTAKKARK